MAVQCTGSIAPGPGRIRDFRHRLVGAVTGVRVVVAATGSPPTRYPAGVNAALAYELERLQFRLERVVLLLIAA